MLALHGLDPNRFRAERALTVSPELAGLGSDLLLILAQQDGEQGDDGHRERQNADMTPPALPSVKIDVPHDRQWSADENGKEVRQPHQPLLTGNTSDNGGEGEIQDEASEWFKWTISLRLVK